MRRAARHVLHADHARGDHRQFPLPGNGYPPLPGNETMNEIPTPSARLASSLIHPIATTPLTGRDRPRNPRVIGCVEAWLGGAGERRASASTAITTLPSRRTTSARTSGSPAREPSRRPQGRPGSVPGSMGTASYVVVGKGDKLSLNSSPHGAGRAHSRSAARRTFTPGCPRDHGHGRCRGPGQATHGAPDRERQGRLTSVLGDRLPPTRTVPNFDHPVDFGW